MNAHAGTSVLGLFVRRYWPILALLVVLLLTSAVRIRLLNVPLERDEGEYAYTAQLLLAGHAPFDGAYSLKLPGTAMMYAGSFLAFGQSVAAIRFGLLLVNVATVLLLVGIGKKIGGSTVAFATGATFAFASLSVSVFGFSANTEHYAILFVVAGTYLLLAYRERPTWFRALLVGLALGIALLMKQHAALFALWAFLWLWWYARKQLTVRQTFFNVSSFAVATLAPLALLVLYVWARGTLPAMTFWTWTYARAYAAIAPVGGAAQNFIIAGAGILITLGGILALAALGLGNVFRPPRGNERWFVATWIIASSIALSIGFYFRGHYFILILPALCVCAGLGVRAIAQFLNRHHGKRVALVGAAAVLGLVLLWVAAREVSYWFRYSANEFSMRAYPFEDFTTYREIANDVAKLVRPGDRMAVVGSEPELLFYSHTVSVTGYLYMYPFLEQQPYRERMFEEFTREVEGGRPDILVVVADHFSWGGQPWEVDHPVWQWLTGYQKSYDIVLQRELPVQWKISSARQQALPKREWLAVYRRRL